jgi:hypothetical protein
MHHRFLAAAAFFSLLVPAPAQAWGAAAHRYIMRRAIDLLPAEIRPFFAGHADELVLRVNDPDLWRTAGWPDDPNHFVDFGAAEYGVFPFAALPREYGAAVEKFGAATVTRLGTLPWRLEEEFGNLRRGFEGFDRGFQYAPGNTVLFAAVAAHYMQDAHQPFHATIDFDGQRTNQTGIHARFETTLFERYEARLAMTMPTVPPVVNARDRAFDVLIRSYTLVDPVLAADRQAAEGRDVYDDVYFDRFFAGVKGMLEQQIAASVSQTAALITGAWQAAGKPTPKDRVERPRQKIRQPG